MILFFGSVHVVPERFVSICIQVVIRISGLTKWVFRLLMIFFVFWRIVNNVCGSAPAMVWPVWTVIRKIVYLLPVTVKIKVCLIIRYMGWKKIAVVICGSVAIPVLFSSIPIAKSFVNITTKQVWMFLSLVIMPIIRVRSPVLSFLVGSMEWYGFKRIP